MLGAVTGLVSSELHAIVFVWGARYNLCGTTCVVYQCFFTIMYSGTTSIDQLHVLASVTRSKFLSSLVIHKFILEKHCVTCLCLQIFCSDFVVNS